MQQFQQNIICPINKATPGAAPSLIFGVEVGFPNFPINLDPILPGGGTSTADVTDPHYRWNDPWVALDVPLKADAAPADITAINTWREAHQETFSKSYPAGTVDKHGSVVQLNSAYWKGLADKGAKGVMMWSLYNTAFMFNFPDPKDCTYEPCNYDGKMAAAKNDTVFGEDLKSNGYTYDLITALQRSAANDMDTMHDANTYWPTAPSVATEAPGPVLLTKRPRPSKANE